VRPRFFILSLTTVVAMGGSAWTLTGCGDPAAAQADPAFAARSNQAGRFLIGTPESYRRPGVYTRFARSHGVFLISQHGMLTALADTCPNPSHGRVVGVRWNPEAYIFHCPGCGWKFTSDGLPIATTADRAEAPGSVMPLALERCNLRHDGPLYDPGTQLQVNANGGALNEDGFPTNRHIFEQNQWSRPGGIYVYEELRERLDGRGDPTPVDDRRLPALFR
jgi:hypothetical protein